MRTSKTIGGTKYNYCWNGSTLMAQTWGVNTLYFRYDGETPIGFEYNNEHYYYVTNLQGDIIAILDNLGNEVASYTYDAWGNCTITQDTDGIAEVNPLRYRGYYFDSDTDMYYLQSRYYDAGIGRFINADDASMTLNDVFNLFAYCDNNPVMFCDYSGYKKYNRNKVLKYVLKWWTGHNPQYPYYNGGDCANFVSQCLYAGGFPMTSLWSCRKTANWFKWLTGKEWSITNSWSRADSQFKYFKMSSNFDLYSFNRNISSKKKKKIFPKIEVGDILYFDYDSDGNMEHAVIISKVTGSNIFYSGHTNSCYNRNLMSVLKNQSKCTVYILHVKQVWKTR